MSFRDIARFSRRITHDLQPIITGHSSFLCHFFVFSAHDVISDNASQP